MAEFLTGNPRCPICAGHHPVKAPCFFSTNWVPLEKTPMAGFGWGFLAKDAPWAVLKAQVMAMNVGGEVMSEYDKLLKELELVPSPVRNAAGLAIEALVKERDDYKKALNEWVRENAPGGWIDIFRSQAREYASEVERLKGVLGEAIETMELAERVPMIDPQYGEEVEALGRRIGFGALMTSASASWAKINAEQGWHGGGQFVAGPCHGSVLSLLKKMRAALEAKP